MLYRKHLTHWAVSPAPSNSISHDPILATFPWTPERRDQLLAHPALDWVAFWQWVSVERRLDILLRKLRIRFCKRESLSLFMRQHEPGHLQPRLTALSTRTDTETFCLRSPRPQSLHGGTNLLVQARWCWWQGRAQWAEEVRRSTGGWSGEQGARKTNHRRPSWSRSSSTGVFIDSVASSSSRELDRRGTFHQLLQHPTSTVTSFDP